MDILLFILLGSAIGGGIAFFYFKQQNNTKLLIEEKELLKIQQQKLSMESEIKAKEIEVKEIEFNAKEKAKALVSKARDEAQEIRLEVEKIKSKHEEKEQHLEKREKQLDEKFTAFEKLKELQTEKDEQKKEKLLAKEEELKKEEVKLKTALDEQKNKLSEIANMSQEEAKQILLVQVENEIKGLLLKHVERIEADIKEEASKKAQKIICQAIQRYSAEVASENMTTIVEIPNDDIKGRIIGREGRNINAIEQATGVDIIVDDTPNAIIISGFDLVRRYVAKKLIEKLIEDGRIHPARIEELVIKVRENTNELLKELGEKVLIEMGISGIHPDLIKILGRLRFRTSYGQNQLKHCKEVGYLAMAIASEVGIDPYKAKLAGLFHDIGKAVDHEIEGNHAIIGYEILKKYKIDPEVCEAVKSHHEDVPVDSALGFIVCAADAISGARPGARRESFEAYIKRLKDLENIANTFKGVKQSYVLQAGREVRVLINPAELDDYATKKMALAIAEKIEKEMNYPGQIKVHVLREVREIEFAK